MALTNEELQQILIYLLFKTILDLNNNLSTFYKSQLKFSSWLFLYFGLLTIQLYKNII